MQVKRSENNNLEKLENEIERHSSSNIWKKRKGCWHSRGGLKMTGLETVRQYNWWHLEHKHGLGLKVVFEIAPANHRGRDLRRGGLRGLQGGRPTVTSIMGQLGGRWKGWVRELFNVRMWGRGLGGLFLPKGLFEWASQLKKGQKLPFSPICTRRILLWGVSLQVPS